GSILFRGEDLVGRRREQLRRYRWQNVSMVFQSAMNALNPVMRVGDQFVDMMRAHERVSKRTALARAAELLDVVGIDRRRVRAFPHELSGGMRQRVIIATAPSARLHASSQHPYTRGLMESFPPLTGPLRRLVGIPGSPPDLADPPSGCRFHPRCPLCVPGGPAYRRQTTERPLLRTVGPEHFAACHLV